MIPSRGDQSPQNDPDVVYELARSQYHRVAPLFEGVWIDRALIDSVIEGNEEARVFTDDTTQPGTVLICCKRGDYIIAGDTVRGPVRQFIRDLPNEVQVFD